MALHYSLGQIARIVKGTLSGDATILIDQVVTDSHEKSNGALFIALRGNRFDGHDFASIATANGARAVLVHKQIDGLMSPYILVKDTAVALTALGAAKRKSFPNKVAAVTGSSGKTTTRRLLQAILSEKWSTHQPKKNFNNHIGVPLTLLDLDASHGAAVLELGCSDFGEIAALTALCDPDVGLVTNVGPAHLEKLGSLDGVARAKGELFLKMRKDAVAVVNGDDDQVAAMVIAPKRRIVFGSAASADVRLLKQKFLGVNGRQLVIDILGRKTEITLRLLGAHNALNALAAIAAAAAFGMEDSEIQAGIAKVLPEAGRLNLQSTKAGFHLLDDTYNANPSSMRAALETLREMAEGGRVAAVLGDMLELGSESEAAHIEIGHLVAALGIDMLITVGKGGRSIALGAVQAGMNPASCMSAEDCEEAAEQVMSAAGPEDWVLVKGSRGMSMDTVTSILLKGSV